jgi:tetratricopeptide (TPR) repeat protein
MKMPKPRSRSLLLATAMRLALPACAVIVPALLTPAAAHAQAGKKGAKDKDPKLAEAKKLFEQATEAYGAGRYEDAVRDWLKSYELSGKPLIFESIANAYERLGDKQKAREYLTKWRAEAPREEHQQLDARIKALDERIAAAEKAEAARKEEEAKRQAEGSGAAKAEREAKEKARSTRLVLALATGGAGVLAVGAGIAVAAVGAGQRPDPEQACAKAGDQTLCKSSAKDAIESSSTLTLAGDITWIAGAVLVAAGGALLITLPPAPGKEGGKTGSKGPANAAQAGRWISVAPVVGVDGGGVGLRGQF